MIELPNKKKCYNLQEQVAQNLLNITYLAEQYKNIDALPVVWQTYKEEFDRELETFGDWTTTFEGWENTLSTYLANMSSAAVGAIAGENIAPANVSATGAITGPSIVETMTGYSYDDTNKSSGINVDYAGVVKNGNKITFVIAGNIVASSIAAGTNFILGEFVMPSDIHNKLYPMGNTDVLDCRTTLMYLENNLGGSITGKEYCTKRPANKIRLGLVNDSSMTGTFYYRYEVTFLLSDNLAA